MLFYTPIEATRLIPTDRQTDRPTLAYLDKLDSHGVQSLEAVGGVRRLHRLPPQPFQVFADRLRKEKSKAKKTEGQTVGASRSSVRTQPLPGTLALAQGRTKYNTGLSDRRRGYLAST